MPYDYREMGWQHHESVWPDCLMDVLEAMGKETGHTPDETVLLLVNYAMDRLCDVGRSDAVMETTWHLSLFVRQWLRHEFPEQWKRAMGRSIPATPVTPDGEERPDRKEWWDE